MKELIQAGKGQALRPLRRRRSHSAWLLAQKPLIVPIPGTTKLLRLEENLDAAAIELSSDDLREIESSASQITLHGGRYSEAGQRMIDR